MKEEISEVIVPKFESQDRGREENRYSLRGKCTNLHWITGCTSDIL